MEINKELSEKIQELQISERNLQAISMEKQTFQVEVNQINNAFDEIKKSAGDVYKILGGLMLHSSKETLNNELQERKKIIELRISSLEKQEKSIEERVD